MTLYVSGFNSESIGAVRDISLSGLKGAGVYVLYFRLNITTKVDSMAYLSQLGCRIDGSKGINENIANGFYENAPVAQWGQHTGDTYLGFYFYLSASQVCRIEQIRNGGDLDIGVWLSGISSYKNKSDAFCNHGSFRILKQEWLQALEQMGYMKTLLFELAVPSNSEVGDKIFSFLEKAQGHILNGHYQVAIGHCRHILELLESQRADKELATAARNAYDKSRESMTIAQRMLYLREVLKNITQLGNHPTDNEFSRHQAQSVLGMTIALLSSPEVGIIN